MPDRELTDADMAQVQRELDELIRRGLVFVTDDGGLVLTDAGTQALNDANAQTWN